MSIHSATPRSGRRPLRQLAVVGELRQLIINGDYPPGSRIPPRLELQRRFDVSCITLQRAVDRLGSEGLVEARGPNGTFVVDRPPHLHRIVLVFPYHGEGHARWNGYYAALERAALRLRDEHIDLSMCAANQHAAFARLQEACGSGLVAGLIFACPPETWQGTPLAEAPLPRVSLADCQHPGAVMVRPDHLSLARCAAEFLASKGCRRPAVITSAGISERPAAAADWSRTFAAAGIPLRPQWLLGADLNWPTSAMNLARLLMQPHAGERPDALLIADDNFEEPVLAGLMSEGIRVGSEVMVLAHANFPRAATSALPVLRLGFDVVALLRLAIERIRSLQAGGAAEHHVMAAAFARSEVGDAP